MKILFFTSKTTDYMEDCLLHGLREILGNNLTDYPKKEIMYKQNKNSSISLHGLGFTLTGLLTDIDIDRKNIFDKVKENYFDYVIFPSIYRQYDLFKKINKFLIPSRTIFIDGSDKTRHLSEFTFYLKKTFIGFSPKIFSDSLYFKRELTDRTYSRFPIKPFYNFLNKLFPVNRVNIRPISFGIPEEKIVQYSPKKEKRWPVHIVDEELISSIPGSHISYAFDNEKDYYSDLQKSKYGITTKRAGWDCMRHYEIAANGAIICFKNFELKPTTCAPFDLKHDLNCISYSSFDDLNEKIESLSEKDYSRLLKNSINWVKSKTTKNIALYLLEEIKKNK